MRKQLTHIKRTHQGALGGQVRGKRGDEGPGEMEERVGSRYEEHQQAQGHRSLVKPSHCVSIKLSLYHLESRFVRCCLLILDVFRGFYKGLGGGGGGRDGEKE